MTSADLKSVLNFSSFRPEADDPSAAWKKRFPGKRSVLFGVGRASLSWQAIGEGGGTEDVETVRADPKEILTSSAASIKDKTDDGWCLVSMNTRYTISLENNLSRRPGSEELLKTNARSVLGGRYERGKLYAMTHNPETNSSLLVSFEEDQTRRAESMFREFGFHVGRMCCGTYVLLRHALSVTNTSKGSDKPFSTLYVVLCEGAVCALVQDQDRWLELRSRTDVYDADISAVGDILAPFHARLAPEVGITLICDTPLSGIEEVLSLHFPGRAITDLSKPGLLAGLVTQN